MKHISPCIKEVEMEKNPHCSGSVLLYIQCQFSCTAKLHTPQKKTFGLLC